MANQIETLGLYDLSSSSGDEKSSLLYSMLPRMIRTRMKRLSSFRRSIGSYVLGYETPQSDISPRSSRAFSDLATPPPGYTSRISLSEPVSDDEDGELSRRRYSLVAMGKRPPQDNKSGIQWNFASQGLSLVNVAAEEASTRSPQTQRSQPSLARQLYVHGLTYLLRGLPLDLSPDEKMGIWSAVPLQVQEIAPICSSDAVVTTDNNLHSASADEPSSALQRLIAAIIFQIIVVTQILLPYLRYLFAVVYTWERKHKISEKLVSSGIQTCENMATAGLQISSAISRMNNGKVGHAANDLMIWWIKGFTGGIHQGIGDGLAALNADATASTCVKPELDSHPS